MNSSVREINSSEFESEVKNHQGICILDFYSTECPPCEALAPKLDSIAHKFEDSIKVIKIYRQDNRELANSLSVSSSPTLVFFKDGKVQEGILAGGIKKSEIINKLQQLSEGKLKEKNIKPIEKINADVIILGGGPAGLTAAIYSAQSKLKTVLVDIQLPGGQVATTHMISNFPGTATAMPGYQLAHNMVAQAKEAGVITYGAADISKVDIGSAEKVVEIDGEFEIKAPVIMIASGASPRMVGVKGEKEFKGKGVSYCAICDGKYYAGKKVAVIGGGNSAVEESHFLTQFADKVIIIHQFDHFQANKEAQEKIMKNNKVEVIWQTEPRAIHKNSKENTFSLELENVNDGSQSILEVDGIFIYVGMKPNTDGLSGSLKMSENGYIITDEQMQTSISGVYAIGDIREKKIRQAITAAADGCIAAVAAEKYIRNEL